MTRHTTIALALSVALLATACGGGGDEGAGGTGAGGDGGGGGSGGSGGGIGGLPADPEPPVAASVEARVVGRTGRDLRVTVEGSDPNGDVVMLRLRPLDASGGELAVVDLDDDGAADSSTLPAPLGAPVLGQATFTAGATVHRLYLAAPTLASVGVRLVDRHGLESEEQVVAIATQPILASGESCDPSGQANRCEDGKGCHGEPPVCADGVAPEIGRFAYLRTSTSPRILIEGTEPEDDLTQLRLDFLDSRGQPVSVDLDGDDNPDASFFEFDVVGYAIDGTFFVEIAPIEGFDTLVPQLSAVATDAAGNAGGSQQAKAAIPGKRSRSQSCDPRGFDICGSGLVCMPGIVGLANKCETLSRTRDAKLDVAPVLDPALGRTVFVGRAEGSSVLDAPVDCSAGDPTGRPEGIAKLHLAAAATRLTLSTESPWTDFDSTVYLLPADATSSAGALGCGDDSPSGSASLVELENVPAGDYLVVVDSWNSVGGNFELSVTVE